MDFKRRIQNIWQNKLYRRLIKSAINGVICIVGFTMAYVSTTFKYSEVDYIFITPPDQVIQSADDKNIGQLLIEGSQELHQESLSGEFVPVIKYKNFNGDNSPSETIDKGACKFSFEQYDVDISSLWWLNITDIGLLTWSLPPHAVELIHFHIYINCTVKPHGFDKWYDSNRFLLDVQFIGSNP